MASEKTRRMVALAVLAAIALVVTWLGRLSIAPSAPFLKYDPKDVVILMAGFLYGPLPAVLVSLSVSLIEMVTVSDAGPIGMLMNVLASCSFMLPPALLYRKLHRLSGAVLGLVLGVAAMTGMMLLWNYFITPFYMGVPREVVAGMLLPVFLPFNLIKGALNASLTLLIYKPLANALRRAHMMPAGAPQGIEGGGAGVAQKRSLGVWVAAAAVLLACVGGVLLWQSLA